MFHKPEHLKRKENNISILNSYDNFYFEVGDITSTNIIEKCRPTKIIHLASMAGVRYSIQNPKLYNEANGLFFKDPMKVKLKGKSTFK